MEHKDFIQKAKRIAVKDASIFVDFYEPAFCEKIDNEHIFKLDCMMPIDAGSPTRIMIRKDDASTNHEPVVLVGTRYRESFKISELIAESLIDEQKINSDAVDSDTPGLVPGNYKIFICVETIEGKYKSREHKFSIVKQKTARDESRKYCAYAWKDLLLREYGIEPCCYLNLNEKLLYNAHGPNLFDPWNSKSYQALRQSFVDGNTKYCTPDCIYMTDTPLSLSEFASYGEGIDKTKFVATEEEKSRYRSYINGDVVMETGPARISVMVGTICNIDCIFCPIPFLDNRRTVFTEDMLELLKRRSPTASRITFTGGEPLVYIKQLRELQPLFHENMTVQIVTNGVAVNQLTEFATNSNLALRISINCANKDDYIYLHEKDFFERILKSIQTLKEQRPDVYISLKYIVMKRTVGDVLEFAKIGRKFNVNEVAYTELWIKTQSKINPKEKILPGDQEFLQANKLLAEAKRYAEDNGIGFSWTGWNIRADQYTEKSNILEQQGTDEFAWAE